jgi:hypothetical protein
MYDDQADFDEAFEGIVTAMVPQRFRIVKLRPKSAMTGFEVAQLMMDQHMHLPWRVYAPDGQCVVWAATFNALLDFWAHQITPAEA